MEKHCSLSFPYPENGTIITGASNPKITQRIENNKVLDNIETIERWSRIKSIKLLSYKKSPNRFSAIPILMPKWTDNCFWTYNSLLIPHLPSNDLGVHLFGLFHVLPSEVSLSIRLEKLGFLQASHGSSLATLLKILWTC